MIKYWEKFHSVYEVHDRSMDYGVLVMSLLTIVVSLFYPCLGLDIIGLALGVVGILYWGSAIRYLRSQIDMDLLLIQGNFLLKSVVVSVLSPFVLYFVCFMLSFCPSLGLTNSGIASEAFEQDDNLILQDSGSGRPHIWAIYYHYVDPGNQHMAMSHTARGIVGICSMLGIILLNGLLVSSLIGWVDKRKNEWDSGAIRYRLKDFKNKNFAIVIGANEIVCSVIKNLLAENAADEINNKNEQNNTYVVLQTNREATKVRQELSSHLSDDEMKRVIIYFAQRDTVRELHALYPDKATEIYILGESTETEHGETYHDAMNMRCVNLLSDILAEVRETSGIDQYKRKVCKVMFDYQSTYSIFQFSDIRAQVNQTLVFIPFNRYESWARKVLVEGFAMNDCHVLNGKEITYTPLDGNGISPDSDDHVHLVIVGMSKMGVALGVQALLQAHYLNYAHAEIQGDQTLKNKRRTRITFIDAQADKEMNFFKGRYDNLFSLMRSRYIDAETVDAGQLWFDAEDLWDDPFKKEGSRWHHLCSDGSNFIDAEVEFIKGEIESAGVREYLSRLADTKRERVRTSRLTIAICLTRTHQAVSAALYMPTAVYTKAQEIWVYQKEASDIIDNLVYTEQKDLRYKKLRAFGMLYGDYMSDRTLYLKGLLVNAAYDVNNESTINFIDKDTYTNLRSSWKKLSIDKKLSNKFFADSVYQKIRGVHPDIAADKTRSYSYKYTTGLMKTCSKDEFESILAACEHDRWTMQQLLLGYSPCDKELDDRFKKLNEEVKNGTSGSAEKFKALKNEYKEGEYRIHPNICEYSHLPAIDHGAQGYDIYLNEWGIRYILQYVDGHNNSHI